MERSKDKSIIISLFIIVSGCLAKTQVLVQIGPNGYLNRLAHL